MTVPDDGPVAGHVVWKVLTPAVAEGVAQVPSPRQKVVLDADVPLLRFVTGRLPVTPVVRGKPVAFVRVAEDGVPSAGVTSVGDVARTTFPVPVVARAVGAATDPVPLPTTVLAACVARSESGSVESVAKVPNGVPLVLVQVIAPVPEAVQSPDIRE